MRSMNFSPEKYQGPSFAQMLMCSQLNTGPVAHLVEHIICNDGVAGSSPVGSTEKSPPCADFFVDPNPSTLKVLL